MTAQKSTLVFSDWVKITGYVIGILAVVFGYKSSTPTSAPVNLSMPVRAVRLQAPEDLVQVHKELADMHKLLMEMKVKQDQEQKEKPEVDASEKDSEKKVDEQPVEKQVETPVKQEEVVVDDGSEVPWLYDEAEARALARKLHRPLGIAFATDACDICEKVKDKVYKNRQVWQVMHTKYVLLWVYVGGNDQEAFQKAQRVAMEYKVPLYPRFIIDKNAVGHTDSLFMPSTDPQQFLKQLI